MIELDTIYNEDCLEGMKRIPDGSVDMVLCDLPYGKTMCKWDVRRHQERLQAVCVRRLMYGSSHNTSPFLYPSFLLIFTVKCTCCSGCAFSSIWLMRHSKMSA